LAIQADVTDKAAMRAVAEQLNETEDCYGIVANARITRDNTTNTSQDGMPRSTQA